MFLSVIGSMMVKIFPSLKPLLVIVVLKRGSVLMRVGLHGIKEPTCRPFACPDALVNRTDNQVGLQGSLRDSPTMGQHGVSFHLPPLLND